MSGLIICTAKTACAVCLSSRTAEPVFFKLFIGLGKATHDFNSVGFLQPSSFWPGSKTHVSISSLWTVLKLWFLPAWADESMLLLIWSDVIYLIYITSQCDIYLIVLKVRCRGVHTQQSPQSSISAGDLLFCFSTVYQVGLREEELLPLSQCRTTALLVQVAPILPELFK